MVGKCHGVNCKPENEIDEFIDKLVVKRSYTNYMVNPKEFHWNSEDKFHKKPFPVKTKSSLFHLNKESPTYMTNKIESV